MSEQVCLNKACNSYGSAHPNCQCYGMAHGGTVSRFCGKTQEHKKGCNFAKGGFALQDETASHYVLTHPKGDQLKIAKHGLSNDMHAHIKKLAKGGEVKSPISTGFTNATGATGIAQGMQNIKNYAEGTPEEPIQEPEIQSAEPVAAAPQGQPPVTINIQSGGGDRQPQSSPASPEAGNYQVPTEDKTPDFFNKVKSVGKKAMNFLNQPITDEAIAQEQAQAKPQGAQYQNAVDTQPMHGNAPPLPPPQEQAPVQQPPQQTMPSIDPEVKKLQEITQQQQAKTQEFHERAINILHDLSNDKIDFNRAWSNKSVPNKILAGIGIALSGIGSGMTKQPNLALEMINKEIERDIEAQKASIGKKATTLDGYAKAYGSENAGANAYREDLQALVAAKMQQYSMKMQGNMMQGAGGGGMGQYLNMLRSMGSPMAKSLEERLVPTVSDTPADIPVPAEDREVMAKGMQFDKVLGELEQISKDNPYGSLNPIQNKRAKALASDAKTLYQGLNHQGVFKEATQKFDESLIPSDPLELMAFMRTSPVYEETRRLARGKMESTIGKYWFHNPLKMAESAQLTHRPGIKTQNVNLKR